MQYKEFYIILRDALVINQGSPSTNHSVKLLNSFDPHNDFNGNFGDEDETIDNLRSFMVQNDANPTEIQWINDYNA